MRAIGQIFVCLVTRPATASTTAAAAATVVTAASAAVTAAAAATATITVAAAAPVVAAAKTASSLATTESTATASFTGFFLFCFIYNDCTSTDLCTVQFFNCFFCGFIIRHFNKTKSLASAREFVCNNLTRANFSILFKNSLQFSFLQTKRKTTHENVHNFPI